MTSTHKADRSRDPQTTGNAVPAPRPAGRGRPTALLIGAVVLALAGLLELHHVWVNLPVSKLNGLSPNAVVQAFRAARVSWTGDTLDGMLLAIISSHFTNALEHPDRLNELYEDARNGYSKIAGTQLARLQLAAMAMLRFEHNQVPVGDWWAALEQFRAGLDSASFAHCLPPLLAANTAVYTQLGIGPGTARRSAQTVVGYPHGPFLEYFAAQSERMARAREEAGDGAAAAACRQLLRRLLRQWTLDPGPASVRLLAAELLANSLAADHTTSAPASSAEIVRGLRRWQETYRAKAAQRSPPLPVISYSYVPLPDPQAADRLRWALALLLWLAPALIAAAIIALLTATPWLRGPNPGSRLRAALLGGLLLSLGLLLASGLYWQIDRAGALNDLRRFGTSDAGWPRSLLVPAGLVIVIAIVLIAWPARGSRRLSRMAAWMSSMTIVLAAALLAAGLWTQAAITKYETRTAELIDSGTLEAITGPAADRDLDPLRAWTP